MKDHTTPAAPITSGEALTTAYAVMAVFDYSADYLIAVFEDKGEADACRADCVAYERTRPTMPEQDDTIEAWERWQKADEAWQDEHPAGRDGVSANSFIVVDKPLHKAKRAALAATEQVQVPSGEIPTWQERRATWIENRPDVPEGPGSDQAFMLTEIADLRAALAQRAGAADKPVAQAEQALTLGVDLNAEHAEYCEWLDTFHPAAMAHVSAWNGWLAAKVVAACKAVAATADAAPAGAVADKERLDWLDQNIYCREMDDFDRSLYGEDTTMWVFFAKSRHGGGTARERIDEAREAAAEVTLAPATAAQCNGCDPAEGFCRACRDAEAAAATAASSVPDGYVVVPKEPTKEMSLAAVLTEQNDEYASYEAIYSAMVGAATKGQK
jgi:hypothetical protein